MDIVIYSWPEWDSSGNERKTKHANEEEDRSQALLSFDYLKSEEGEDSKLIPRAQIMVQEMVIL